MTPQRWRRLRQISQILTFLLFLYLFVYATFLNPRRAWADLFYRLDPLVAASATLAGRAWIAGLGWALLTVLVTLVFGRVWCGWICPLGTVLAWLSPRQGRRRPRRSAPPEGWRVIKYVLLFVILFAALLGNQTLMFLDPLTILTRTLAVSVWPGVRAAVYAGEAALYQVRFLWGPLDVLHRNLVYPIFQDVASYFTLAVPVFLFFAAIVALNGWVERFWCRYLCPLGGLLGLLSRLSLVRREVGETCARCALCTGECPTDTIDPQDGYRSDPAECIVCYDCIVDCTREGVAFRWQLPGWHPAPGHAYDPGRRALLASAGAAAVGVALAGAEPIQARQPAHMVRPPGATLTDFTTLCVRCGECMRVCPTQGLQPLLFEAGVQNVLTPRMVSRLGYCDFNCNACGEVCPTGAIPPLDLETKRHTPMGLARIDRSRCLPWAHNIPCIVCEEVCPVRHKAIWLTTVETLDARGEPITLQQPYVVKELCIGCGICEYQCPMGGEAAVRVYTPTEVGRYLGDDPDYRPHRRRRRRQGDEDARDV
jgi:polyferredoxin